MRAHCSRRTSLAMRCDALQLAGLVHGLVHCIASPAFSCTTLPEDMKRKNRHMHVATRRKGAVSQPSAPKAVRGGRRWRDAPFGERISLPQGAGRWKECEVGDAGQPSGQTSVPPAAPSHGGCFVLRSRRVGAAQNWGARESVRRSGARSVEIRRTIPLPSSRHMHAVLCVGATHCTKITHPQPALSPGPPPALPRPFPRAPLEMRWQFRRWSAPIRSGVALVSDYVCTEVSSPRPDD